MKKCKCEGNMTTKTVLVTVDGKENAYLLFVCERCGASVRVTDKRDTLTE